MKNSDIFSGEGDVNELSQAFNRVMKLGVLDKQQVDVLVIATALGTGRPISFNEAATVVNYAFETLLRGSMLKAVLSGEMDMRVENDNDITFAAINANN